MPDPRTPSPEPADLPGPDPAPAVPPSPSARDAAVMAEFDRATRDQQGPEETASPAPRRGLFRRRATAQRSQPDPVEPATEPTTEPGAAPTAGEAAERPANPAVEPSEEAPAGDRAAEPVVPEPVVPTAPAAPATPVVPPVAPGPDAVAENAGDDVADSPRQAAEDWTTDTAIRPAVPAAGAATTPSPEPAPLTDTAIRPAVPTTDAAAAPATDPAAALDEAPGEAEALDPADDPTDELDELDEAEPGTAPVAETHPEPRDEPRDEPGDEPGDGPRHVDSSYSVRTMLPVLLLRAAHPKQAVLTALVMGIVAAVAGRPGNEALLVLVTVFVGQVVLGWHNDVVDAERDRRQEAAKPVAQGLLEPGTVWFAMACAVLVLVPLAVANGVTAAVFYLASVLVGLIGNVLFRDGWFSWLTWAGGYALLVPFLSYGGWGGQAHGAAPEPALVVLAALLGVGVHVLNALPGLVADNAEGSGSLPLRLALRTGAPKLLLLTGAYLVLVAAGLVVAGLQVGLTQ